MTSKATCLAAKGNGLAAKPTTSGVKGIALMAVFRALNRGNRFGFAMDIDGERLCLLWIPLLSLMVPFPVIGFLGG
ncbi:hypothetical protein [Sinomicrobium sp. M5D2P9]